MLNDVSQYYIPPHYKAINPTTEDNWLLYLHFPDVRFQAEDVCVRQCDSSFGIVITLQ